MSTSTIRTARQLIFPEPYRVDFAEVELPAPGPRQILARTLLSGISHGTEMVAYSGGGPFRDQMFTAERRFAPRPADQPFYPYRHAGYDAVGVVEAVGAEVRDVRVGDRVWAPARHQTALVTDDYLQLPESISNDHAVFINLAAIGLVAVNDAEINLGDTVAVFGGGTLGQLVVQLAFLSGATRVLMVEPLAARREWAVARSAAVAVPPGTDLRAFNDGQWPDAVIECSGSVEGLRDAILAAGLAGTVVAAGFYAAPATALLLGAEFLHNRVTIKASMSVWDCPSRQGPKWNATRARRTVLRLMETGKLRLDGWVSARFPFEEAARAYETLHADPARHLKVVLTYSAMT